MKTIYLFLLVLLFVPSSLWGQKVFKVAYESQTDLKVFIVKYESQAGWNKTEKQQHLL